MKPQHFLLLAGIVGLWAPLALAAESLETCTLEALSADAAACDRLIAAERDPTTKAKLLHRRAYALVEKDDLDKALQNLDEALRLDPDLAEALHERAYIFVELRDFDRALADLDREIGLRPDFPNAYEERAFARHGSGDFAGAHQDWIKVAALRPGHAMTLLHRSEAALWLGKFDEAIADADQARGLGDDSGKLREKAQKQLDAIRLMQTGTGAADPAARCDSAMGDAKLHEPGLIGDCTTAFFRAVEPSKKAGYLTVRSLAWMMSAKDVERWKKDAETAVAIDPRNGDWHANLGGVYERFGRHRAALRAFNRAVALKPGYVAYAGRASSRYELGDKAGAFADAKKSFEIHPNIVALIVLGDLSKDGNDKESAKLYWMGAWQLGSRDDGLRERLRLIGVVDPDREPR